METFSRMLSNYVSQSGKTNIQIASDLDVDKLDVVAWKEGKRFPSEAELEKMMELLVLPAEDRKTLEYSWYISRLKKREGRYAEECLDSIEDMLNEICMMDLDISLDKKSQIDVPIKNTVIGKGNCYQALQSIVQDEQNQESPKGVRIWGGERH